MNDAGLLACSLSRWEGHPRRCRWCNEPLYSPRRRWCSDECATAMLENHYWSAARVAALERDGYRCVRDGCENQRLTIHHAGERAMGRHGQTSCVHHLDGLETLCRPHHLEADRLRLLEAA